MSTLFYQLCICCMIPHAHPKIKIFQIRHVHSAVPSCLMESSVPATEPLSPPATEPSLEIRQRWNIISPPVLDLPIIMGIAGTHSSLEWSPFTVSWGSTFFQGPDRAMIISSQVFLQGFLILCIASNCPSGIWAYILSSFLSPRHCYLNRLPNDSSNTAHIRWNSACSQTFIFIMY